MRTTLAMMLAGLLAAGVWVLIEPGLDAAHQRPAADAAAAAPPRDIAGAPSDRAMDPPRAAPRMVR